MSEDICYGYSLGVLADMIFESINAFIMIKFLVGGECRQFASRVEGEERKEMAVCEKKLNEIMVSTSNIGSEIFVVFLNVVGGSRVDVTHDECGRMKKKEDENCRIVFCFVCFVKGEGFSRHLCQNFEGSRECRVLYSWLYWQLCLERRQLLLVLSDSMILVQE